MKTVLKIVLIIISLPVFSQSNQNYFFDRNFEDYCEGHLKLSNQQYLIYGSTSDADSSSSAAYAILVDSNFQHLWSFTQNYTGSDVFNYAVETQQGNILLVGQSLHEALSYQGLIVELDSYGNVISEQRVGNIDYENIEHALVIDANTVIFTGTSTHPNTNMDRGWILQYNLNTHSITQEHFIDDIPTRGAFYNIAQNGDYWFIGSAAPNNFWNAYLVKLDAQFNVLEDTVIAYDTNFKVVDFVNKGNNVVIATASYPNIDLNYSNFLIEADPSLNIDISPKYGNQYFRFEFKSIKLLPNGGIRTMSNMFGKDSIRFTETWGNSLDFRAAFLTTVDGNEQAASFELINPNDSSMLVFGHGEYDDVLYHSLCIWKTNAAGEFYPNYTVYNDPVTIDYTVVGIDYIYENESIDHIKVYNLDGVLLKLLSSHDELTSYLNQSSTGEVKIIVFQYKSGRVKSLKIYD